MKLDLVGQGLTALNKEAQETLTSQAEHTWEEAYKLLSELNVVRTEQDEAAGSATAAEEKTEALRARSVDPDSDEESSHSGEVSALQERISVLSSRESELLAEFEIMRVEVVLLWMELGTLQADALSLRSISVDTHASIIVEYLRSDVHRRCEEYERSHHSQSGYVKALLDIAFLFFGH
ncbi:hypothetical protein ACLOJK_019746 [Asimina triloba]